MKEVFGQMKKNCLMHNEVIFIIHLYSSLCSVDVHKAIVYLYIHRDTLFANVIFHLIQVQRFFLKILICLFFIIYHKYSNVLTYGNILGNFRVLMLLSTTFIWLTLDVLLSVAEFHFFVLIIAGICSEFLYI